MKAIDYTIYVLNKVTPVNQKEKDEIKQAIIYLKELAYEKGKADKAYNYTNLDKAIIKAIDNGAYKRCIIYDNCKDILEAIHKEKEFLPYKILDLRLQSLKKRKKIKQSNRGYGWTVCKT